MQQTPSTVTEPAPSSSPSPATDGASGADLPRPEHPRPDLQRDYWINLNGRWRFFFDPLNRGEQERWYRFTHPAVASRTGEVINPVDDPFVAEITVPFPWESRLSGIGELEL